MASFKHTIPNSRSTASIRLTASLLAAAAGAALLSAAPLGAMAAPADEPYVTATAEGVPAVAVKYGDLDLSTERGARILFARIQLAADEVCPAAADSRSLSRVEARNACLKDAIERAVQQVGSPRLAAVLSAQPGHG
jgi:UrcA family protein